MTSPGQSFERAAVSPLELVFDLVFVFAVSQLSRHLLEHLTWRGAAETAAGVSTITAPLVAAGPLVSRHVPP